MLILQTFTALVFPFVFQNFSKMSMIENDLKRGKREERKAIFMKRKKGAGYCPFKCPKIITICPQDIEQYSAKENAEKNVPVICLKDIKVYV